MVARRLHTNDPQLQLVPPARRAYLLLFALTVLLPTVITVALQAGGSHLPPPAAALAADSLWLSRLLGGAMVLAMTALIFVCIALLMPRHRLSIDESGIEVTTTFYRRRLAWDELKLASGRVIAIDERPELKPRLKTNGVAMPGFASGWFRSRNFTRLFVATAGGKKLLWLPTQNGYDLLLQPRNPAVLLDRLKLGASAQTDQRSR